LQSHDPGACSCPEHASQSIASSSLTNRGQDGRSRVRIELSNIIFPRNVPLLTQHPEIEIQETSANDPTGPRIRCPKCNWSPRAHDRWMCKCGHIWNTFDTGGVCPACLYQWTMTACLACHQWSPHSDWYTARLRGIIGSNMVAFSDVFFESIRVSQLSLTPGAGRLARSAGFWRGALLPEFGENMRLGSPRQALYKGF
jgi:hypothetical protein